MDDLFAGYEAWVGLAILTVLMAGLVLERYPPEVTAAAAAALFLLFGFLSPPEAMEVFSNSAPITIAALFILSGALVRTGVLDSLADLVITRAERQPVFAVAIFLLATMIASAFVNNTPVVLILIPIVMRLAKSLGIAATRLLIPLSYAAILGGTCTLIGTSTNILVDGVARRAGLEAFSIFEITPIGVVAAATGLLVMLLLGRPLLPDRDAAEAVPGGEEEYLSDVTIRLDDEYAGRTIGSIANFNRSGIRIQALRSGGELIRSDIAERELKKGDSLVVYATTSELLTLNEDPDLRVGLRRGADRAADTVAVEAVVAPRHSSIGMRIVDLALGRRYGVRVLGANRRKHLPGPDLENVRLRPADKLLLEGPPANLDELMEDADLVSITRPSGRPYRRGKAPVAVLALVAVVLLAAAGVADIGVLAMVAVAAMLILRCIDADEAWGSVDGSILVLIFAMLMVGQGLANTGAVELIVGGVLPWLADLPPFVTLLALYMLTSVLTEMVTNNAVAVLITPVAVGLAEQLGLDPRPFVVAVMFGASASFATPIGYQTNTLVYGAGNYRFSDFLKIGGAMNVVVGVATSAAIVVFFPF